MKYLEWIGQHWLDILLIGFIIRFGKLLFEMLVQEPLQGDDGHTSMDELAKYSLIVYLGLVLYWIRSSEYPPEVVAYLVLGVAAIAGVKLYLKSKGKEEKDES
jgi:hypothetical protein